MRRVLYILILLVVVTLLSCKESSVEKNKILSRKFVVMGGVILEIKLYNDTKREQDAISAAYLKVAEIDTICNIYNPNSELSKLNLNAFKHPVVCSDVLWDILKKSKQYYELSNGAFDISAAPLMTLWGFYKKRKTLPSLKEITAAKKCVGLDKVIFDEEDKSIKFSIPGMRLDLGGVAKGYAVDQAVKALKKHKIQSGVINLAGNAYCFPVPPPGRSSYSIGVRDPFIKNKLCGVIKISNTSVSTSGDYERFVIIEGKRYSHIMDPRTGLPISNISAVTVVTQSACDADALSTMILINGEKSRDLLLKEFPDINILIIKNSKTNPKGEFIKIGTIWDDVSNL